MTEVCEVNADLVGPPGREDDAKEGSGLEALFHPIPSPRVRTSGHHRADPPSRRVIADGEIDLASACVRNTADEGEVFPGYGMRTERLIQPVMHGSSLGEEHGTRRSAVQPMDGSYLDLDAVSLEMVCHTVSESASRGTTNRVDENPRRFVQDEKVVVLEKDL
jgi:hypothetical protein